MRPPLRLEPFTPPPHQFVTLAPMHLTGLTQSYTCSLEQISVFRQQMRVQFWREFLANCPTIPPVFYGLNESRPSVEKDDEQEVFYTTALPEPLAEGCVEHAHPVTLEGGDYVQFTYEGPGTGVQEFILTVYGTCMPALGLTRRRGQDIERYLLTEASGAQEGDINLRCEYLIPIRR